MAKGDGVGTLGVSDGMALEAGAASPDPSAVGGAGCARCGSQSAPVHPSRAWWLFVVPFWAVLLLTGACFAVMLPLNLVLVPCWLACASAVGPLARRVTRPRCSACGGER